MTDNGSGPPPEETPPVVPALPANLHVVSLLSNLAFLAEDHGRQVRALADEVRALRAPLPTANITSIGHRLLNYHAEAALMAAPLLKGE